MRVLGVTAVPCHPATLPRQCQALPAPLPWIPEQGQSGHSQGWEQQRCPQPQGTSAGAAGDCTHRSTRLSGFTRGALETLRTLWGKNKGKKMGQKVRRLDLDPPVAVVVFPCTVAPGHCPHVLL